MLHLYKKYKDDLPDVFILQIKKLVGVIVPEGQVAL